MTLHSPIDQKQNPNPASGAHDPHDLVPSVSSVDHLPGSQDSLQLRVPR